MVKYIYAGGQRVAMKKGSTVYFLLSDHLGSTTVTANSSTAAEVGELRYKAWGETRYASGTTYTARHFTGQIDETGNIGLYFYESRYYDPVLGRFSQPDTIVPELGNPQAWDRFAYTLNNPVKYIDPSGHRTCTDQEAATGDETCDQNIVDEIDWVIHRVYMGGFTASEPIDSKDQLPSNSLQPPANWLIWVVQAIGLLEDFIPPRATGSNVFTYLTYSEYDDGSVGNFSISVINQSDQSVYLSRVKFSTERWDESFSTNLPSCVECGVFYARSTINNHLATIRPGNSADVNLNTYPSNPTVSITPNYGFPPFSGNVNVLVTAYLYANTVFGLMNVQTSTQIYAPRPRNW